VIAGLVLLIASRMHYTSDILVALFFSTAVWHWFLTAKAYFVHENYEKAPYIIRPFLWMDDQTEDEEETEPMYMKLPA
jgi:hypothetical protein